MIKNIKIFIPLIICYAGLFAVINQYENSYSKTHNINTSFESIIMPEIDVDALIRQDEANIAPGVPFRYAEELDVDYAKIFIAC